MNQVKKYYESQSMLLSVLGTIILVGFIVLSFLLFDSTNFSMFTHFIPLIIVGFILSIVLYIRIDSNGISIKYFPLHFTWVNYRWEEIEKIEIIQYKPIRQFGGWGIRFGFDNTKCFTVSGNKGLKIYFKDGKKRLIGTRKPDELKAWFEVNKKELLKF